MFLYRKIATPCLKEDDTYALRSRKLVVIAFSFIALNALLLGVPICITSAVYDPSLGSYLVGATMVFVTFTSSAIPYGYLRYTKTLPYWVTDLQTWTALGTSATCFTLFTHQSSTTILVSVAVWVGIIAQVRWRPLFLCYGILINILHALINDFAEELPALHERFYSKQILSVRLMYLIGANLAPQVFFGVGIYMIMREVIGRENQADAAIAMNLAVADKLRRYDTDGVAEILAANQGKVDEKLLNAFAAIQHNLQEYRPHIPDYVIEATTSDHHQHNYSSCPATTAASYPNMQAVNAKRKSGTPSRWSRKGIQPQSPPLSPKRGLGAGQHPQKHQPSTETITVCNNLNPHIIEHDISPLRATEMVGTSLDVEDDMVRTARNPMALGRPLSLKAHNPADGFEGDHHRVLVDDSPTLVHTSHGFNASDQPLHFYKSGRGRASRIGGNTSANNNMAPRPSQSTNTNSVFNGRATTVYIRFIVHAPSEGRQPHASNEVSEVEGDDGGFDDRVDHHVNAPVNILDLEMRWLAKCVDVGMRLAKAHGGALQYMQGCGLMVSFNAASRVTGHERKACLFALMLKEELKRFDVPETLSMHTSIVTTQVLSFFAGNRDQLMLTVLGGFMPQHTAMHSFMDMMGSSSGVGITAIIVSPSVLAGVGDDVLRHRLVGVTSIVLSTAPNASNPPHHGEGEDTIVIRLQQLLGLIGPSPRDVGGLEYDDEGDNFTPNPLTTGTVDTVEIAVAFAMNGSLDAAISALTNPFKSRVDSNVVNDDDDDLAIHRSLLAHIQRCRHSGASFVVTAEPTTMW